jgi:glycosyltransferase involved in cell wall biosynthesis
MVPSATPLRGHVCVFTSVHPTDDVRVATKFASSFLNAGFRVTWIGPNILAHGTDTRDPRISYLTIPAPTSRLARLRGVGHLLRLVFQQRDVDWWYVPDPDAAWVLCRMRGHLRGRIIFDVHEVFHTGHMDTWVGKDRYPKLREAVRRAIADAARRSDLLIGVSEAVLQPYRSPATRTRVVANYAPAWFGEESPRDGDGPRSGLRFFHGNISSYNGTGIVVEAFRSFMEEHPDAAAELILLASEDAAMRSMVDRVVAENPSLSVRVLDRRPHAEMPALLRSCHVGLIAYGRDLGAASFPNRLFEYLACGLAVIAPTYSPLIRDVLQAESVGFSADFEDPSEVAAAMAWCLDNPAQLADMRGRARPTFLRDFNWQAEFSGLLSAMDRLGNPREGSAT